MSTNAKACYDKLGEKVVALLWFDECTQSASLSFFFPSLGLEFSQIFFLSLKQILQSDSHHLITPHPPRSTAPLPMSQSKAQCALQKDKRENVIHFLGKKMKS